MSTLKTLIDKIRQTWNLYFGSWQRERLKQVWQPFDLNRLSNRPWYSDAATDYLLLLKNISTLNVLEFGSGNSTSFWYNVLDRPDIQYICVEKDNDYRKHVAQFFNTRGYTRFGRVFRSNDFAWLKLRVHAFTPDIIVVDDRDRNTTMREVSDYVKSLVEEVIPIILIDDYNWFPKCHLVVDEILEAHSSYAPIFFCGTSPGVAYKKVTLILLPERWVLAKWENIIKHTVHEEFL